MTWIKTISYDDATGKVKELYERIKGPGNNVDNIMICLLYTSPSPRDRTRSRMPSSA